MHPFEVVSRKLPRIFGFTPKVTLEEEIERMMHILLEDEVRKRI